MKPSPAPLHPRSPGGCRLPALVLALAVVSTAGCDRTSAPGGAPPGPFAVADSLQREGRWAEAAEAFRGLRDSLVRTTDTASLWRAQFGLANALTRQGKIDGARSAIDAALELAGSDPYREGETRYLLSVWLDRRGRLDSALVQAQRALELAHASEHAGLESSAYNALGRIYSLSGRYREALQVHEQDLALQRKTGGPEDVALALNEIGIDYRHFGRYADAIAAYEEALGIYRRLENPGRLAMVLYNLANIRLDTGEPERARDLFQQSLAYAEETGQLRGQGFLHNSLAAVYADAGNLSAAREHLQRAYGINRRSGFAYGLVQTEEMLGRVELQAGRLGPAEAWLDSALALADSAGFGRERVSAREALARIAIRHDEGRSGLRWATTANTIADSLLDPAAQYEALLARARALETLGDDRALNGYLEVVRLLESWRGRLALGDLRMGVTEPRLAAYEGAIRASFEADRIETAFDLNERARARLLLDLLRKSDRPEDEAVSGPARYRSRLRELSMAWAEASPDERARLAVALGKLGDSLRVAESRARRDDPRALARYPVPARLGDLQAALASANRGLLTYFWGDDEVYGWWVGSDTVIGVRLGRADSLEATVRFLRAAIQPSEPAAAWEGAARRAYRSFVAPLVHRLPERVLIVPDGPLAYVPFEAFVPEDEGEPLGATRRLAYGPSGSVLAGLQRASASVAWERQALVVADPTFDQRDSLPRLPYAKVEGQQIRRLFARADLLTGRRASPEEWLAHHPGRYRYLHFATHAVVDDRRPDETHLVLARGALGLSRIRSLRLRAELVTLSACETALGRRIRGEGVIGLPHAFLAAGAHGVVVSLWQVRDRAAAEFMARFYRELKAGAAPADALWATRRAYIDAPNARPSLWASFVLVGGLSPTASTASKPTDDGPFPGKGP